MSTSFFNAPTVKLYLQKVLTKKNNEIGAQIILCGRGVQLLLTNPIKYISSNETRTQLIFKQCWLDP